MQHLQPQNSDFLHLETNLQPDGWEEKEPNELSYGKQKKQNIYICLPDIIPEIKSTIFYKINIVYFTKHLTSNILTKLVHYPKN